MGPILLLAAVAGAIYVVERSLSGSSLGTSRERPQPPNPYLPQVPIPTSSSAADWQGWIWPVPPHDGRVAVVTQEYKPGHDPPPGQASSAHANHLGVDIMFPKRAGDPPGPVRHLASKAFIAPEGTKIVAAGPGTIWSVIHSPGYGIGVLVDHGYLNHKLGGVVTFYQHLAELARPWAKGDRVEPGMVLGEMGYAPADPEGLRHLHFELWFPRTGVPQDEWRVDPRPHMRHWRK